MRLDRLLTKLDRVRTHEARGWITSGRVRVSGAVVCDPSRRITRFDTVTCDDRIVQAGCRRVLLMVNKPRGVISATTDPALRTVLDLVRHPNKDDLHVAGRLDRSSTGLVLLTNDGRWSESLTDPTASVEKVYLVETMTPIPADAEVRFAEGFWLASEGVQTRPARLTRLGPTTARVVLTEGRWHQIKRMFHRLEQTRLQSLHRERIGPFELPADLALGRWREIAVESRATQPTTPEARGRTDAAR